jgi:hypothetical protein
MEKPTGQPSVGNSAEALGTESGMLPKIVYLRQPAVLHWHQ